MIPIYGRLKTKKAPVVSPARSTTEAKDVRKWNRKRTPDRTKKMDEDDKNEQPDGLQVTFPGGSIRLTGDTVKQLTPYIGKCLLIASIAYLATVIVGAFK